MMYNSHLGNKLMHIRLANGAEAVGRYCCADQKMSAQFSTGAYSPADYLVSHFRTSVACLVFVGLMLRVFILMEPVHPHVAYGETIQPIAC